MYATRNCAITVSTHVITYNTRYAINSNSDDQTEFSIMADAMSWNLPGKSRGMSIVKRGEFVFSEPWKSMKKALSQYMIMKTVFRMCGLGEAEYCPKNARYYLWLIVPNRS